MTENSKAAAIIHGGLRRRLWPAMLLTLWSSAASAHAQALIEPTLAPLPRWTLSLDAHEGWDSNVRFFAPDGPGDLLTRFAAKLDRTWSSPRGRFALSGGGQGSLYRRVSELNHFSYAADADGSYLLSPRATVRLSDAFRTSYASELVALTQAGLLLPPVISRANTSRGGFSYSASRRTTVSLDLQHETVSFDSPTLVGGSRMAAGAATTHELSRADTVGAGYQIQRMEVPGTHSIAQTFDGTWTRALGASSHARIRAGASRFQLLTSPSSSRTTPVGGAALDARWARQTIEAQYDRYVDLAYGLGRVRINGLLSARYAWSVTPELGFDIRAIRARGRDPADTSFALSTTDLAASLRYALSRNLALAGRYSRRSVAQSSTPPLTSQGASLFVSYQRAWP